MKRRVALLALAMALAFTACGEKANIKEAGDANEKNEEEAKEHVEEQPTQEPEKEQSAQEPEDEEKPVPVFSKGTVDRYGWESEWVGLRFIMPEGMKMATEEELDALMGLSAEILSDDLGEEELKYAELASVKEMMCVDPETNANVIVSVDLLPVELSEELFAQALEETLSSISSMQYERLGDNERVELAGISFLRSGYYVEAVGQKMYLDYYLKTTGMGSRAVSIVVTYGDGCEEQANAMLEGFEAYK